MLHKILWPLVVLAHEGSPLKLPRQAYSNNTINSASESSLSSARSTAVSSSTISSSTAPSSSSNIVEVAIQETVPTTSTGSSSSSSLGTSNGPIQSANSSSSTGNYMGTITAQASPRISAGTVGITAPANSTFASSSANATVTTGTCCYIWPAAVGINHWYSSSMGVTVERQITTWLQSNGTLMPANSTTIKLANVSSLYGSYPNTWQSSSGVILETISTGLVTSYYTTRNVTYTQFTTVTQIPTNERFSGIPNTLLPSNAQLYASTNVIPGTATTFPFQNLVFTSPTPYIYLSMPFIRTSMACHTNMAGWGQPIATTSIIAMPMEEEYVANFDFWDWMHDHNMTSEGASDRAFRFALPTGIPSFLAQIPAVSSWFPMIGTCTLGPGDGEPSIHIPVNQLTDISHVTLTLPGASPSQQTTTPGPSPEPTLNPPAPSPTNDSPTPTPTASDPDEPNKPEEPEPTSEPEEPEGPNPNPDNPTPTTPDGPGSPTDDNDVPALPVTTDNDTPVLPAPEPTGGDSPTQPTGVDIGDLISVIGQVPGASPTNADSGESPSIGDVIATAIGAQPLPTQGEQGGDDPDGNDAAGVPVTNADAQPVQTGGGNNGGSNDNNAAAPVPTAGTPVQITVGGGTVIANPDGGFEIGGQTLQPGSAITEGGNTLSLAPSGTAVIVNGATTPIDPSAAEITIPSSTITANEDGAFVIGTQTLRPGSEVTISGSTLSLASGGTALVVNEATTPIDTGVAATAASITVGDSIVTASPDGTFEIGSQVLEPGSAITVSGTTFSLAPGGSEVVVNGVTSPVEGPVITPGPALTEAGLLTLSGETLAFTNIGSEILIAGQTLSPDNSIIVDDQTLSLLNPSQVVAISGTASSTLNLSPTITSGPAGIEVGIFTLAGQTYSFTDLGATLVIDGETLTPEGTVVVDGQTLSLLNPSELVVVSGSRTRTGDLEATTTLAGPGRTSAAAAPASTAGAEKISGRLYVVVGIMILCVMFV